MQDYALARAAEVAAAPAPGSVTAAAAAGGPGDATVVEVRMRGFDVAEGWGCCWCVEELFS